LNSIVGWYWGLLKTRHICLLSHYVIVGVRYRDEVVGACFSRVMGTAGRRLRLGLVSTYPPIHCGVGEYTRLLAESMISAEQDVEIHVYTFSEAGTDTYSSGQVIVHPILERNSTRYERLLDAIAEVDGLDIIHLQHEFGIFKTPSIISVLDMARQEKLARIIVATLHTVYHPMASGNVEKYVEFNSATKTLDAVIVHSYLQEFELVNQGVPHRIVYRIPHGTSINTFVDVPRHILAEKLGLPKSVVNHRIIAVPGFLRRDKGLETLLEAIRYAKTSHMRLIIAGEPQGESGREVSKLVHSYAAEDERIIYIERYLSNTDVLELAALADLIVLPYQDAPGKYSVSGILHLSMGSLKPIVGTRVPRLIELYQLTPHVTVKPGSPRELAMLIDRVMKNYDDYVTYMAPLYGYAVRTRWLRMARRHLFLYRTLLSQ